MAFERLINYRGGEIWNRLLQARRNFPFERLYYRVGDSESPSLRMVYHYTTVAGLQGILRNNKIWASAAYFLNDSSEIEYGCQLVTRELAVWRDANKENTSFAAQVLRILDQMFSNPRSQVSRTVTTYVTCFCENDNLLSQWRAYGQSGGYSLGFPLNQELTSLHVPGDFWEVRLVRVVYRTWEQTSTINSLLTATLGALGELPTDLDQSQKTSMIADAVLLIQELLLDEVVTFKNPAFSEEKEWRVVVRPRLIPRNEEGAESTKQTWDFKFRDHHGSLVPYIELQARSGVLPIKSIRFGPTLEPTLTETSLRMFLRSCGFTGVEVQGSEIPVRL